MRKMNSKEDIPSEEMKILEELEQVIGNTLQIVNEINVDTVGIKIENNSIIGLGLFNCNLTALPDSISNLQAIKTLNLTYNQFTTFPESLTNLHSLQELEMSLNQLTTLPDSIGNLKDLQKLNLLENQLTTLPESIGKLSSLQILNLAENQLTALPTTFGDLHSLQELHLNQNKLSSIPESFGNLHALQELRINHNQLKSLPWTVWQLKNLKANLVHLEKNAWKGEWIELAERDLSSILEYCRKNASISIFMSHAVVNFEEFRIKEISKHLEAQDEIYRAYYCEQDLKGNIDDFMNDYVPKCQLLLFFASNKSVYDSVDCAHELELARKHNIQIVPLKGKDVDWGALSTVNLSRELGFEFNEENFEEFCKEMYDYILQFKRDVNLFEPEEAQIDRQKLRVRDILNNYISSEEFEENIKENAEQYAIIFQKISNNQISVIEYIQELTKILSKSE